LDDEISETPAEPAGVFLFLILYLASRVTLRYNRNVKKPIQNKYYEASE